MATNLKNFDGLWQAMRSPEEKRLDYLFDEHKDGECDDKWLFERQNGEGPK